MANPKQEDLEKKLVGTEISGCEILSKIAAGGMGTVFKARHKALDRIVCVKILSPALSEDNKAVSLFLTEARAIAELDHPNIVNVYNVGQERGYHFIVMSFINGDNLSNIVKRRPNLPIGFIEDVFIGVLKGLAMAHEKGIIHRDIKPSNILINEKLEPKIVDFGIATKTDKARNSTKTSEMAGTAYFISPEQALGKEIDARADLYSTGATLYYTLTAKFPYTGKNAVDIIQKHINEPVPSAITLRKDMPLWLSQAAQKLMAKKPEDRFQTAKEAIDHFTRMRAEERTSIEIGKDANINISNELSLKVRKEDPHPDSTIRAIRQRMNQRLPRSTDKDSANIEMPVVDFGKDSADIKTPSPRRGFKILTEHSVSENLDKEAKKMRTKNFFFPASLRRLLLLVPLFLVFSAFTANTFFKLGAVVYRDAKAESMLAWTAKQEEDKKKAEAKKNEKKAEQKKEDAAAPEEEVAAPSSPSGDFLPSDFSVARAFKQLFASGIQMDKDHSYLNFFAGLIVIFIIIMWGLEKFAKMPPWLLALALFSFLAGFYYPAGAVGGLISENLFSKDFLFIYMAVGVVLVFSRIPENFYMIPSKIIMVAVILLSAYLSILFANNGMSGSDLDLFRFLKYAGVLLALTAAMWAATTTRSPGGALLTVLTLVSMAMLWSTAVSGNFVDYKNKVVEMAAARTASTPEAVLAKKKAEEESAAAVIEDDRVLTPSLMGISKVALGSNKPKPEKLPIDESLKEKDLTAYFLEYLDKRSEKEMDRKIMKHSMSLPLQRMTSDAYNSGIYVWGMVLFFILANVYFMFYIFYGDFE